MDKRPKELSSDTAKSIDVLNYISKNYSYDYYCLLQPTSPLRQKNFIDICCKKIINDQNKDLLASGYLSHAYKFGSHNNKSRQELGGFFYDDGNVYIFKNSLVKKNGRQRIELK